MAKDLQIARYMKRLIDAVEREDVDAFTETLTSIRYDDHLTALQRGAIWKTIAQEQAKIFHLIMHRGAVPFGEPPQVEKKRRGEPSKRRRLRV